MAGGVAEKRRVDGNRHDRAHVDVLLAIHDYFLPQGGAQPTHCMLGSDI
jgi:hypothetical protein